jgi:hypothetical protein
VFVSLIIAPAIWRHDYDYHCECSHRARSASAIFTRIDGTDQMLVWGQDSSMVPFANTGARWKRSSNVWTATTTTNAPSSEKASLPYGRDMR